MVWVIHIRIPGDMNTYHVTRGATETRSLPLEPVDPLTVCGAALRSLVPLPAQPTIAA